MGSKEFGIVLASGLIALTALSGPAAAQTAPAWPKATVPNVTVPKVTWPKVTWPKVTWPKVTLPKVATPKVAIPKITLPKIDLAKLTPPKITLPAVRLAVATGKVGDVTGLRAFRSVLPGALGGLRVDGFVKAPTPCHTAQARPGGERRGTYRVNVRLVPGAAPLCPQFVSDVPFGHSQPGYAGGATRVLAVSVADREVAPITTIGR